MASGQHRQVSKIRGTKVLTAKGVPIGVIEYTLIHPESGITLFIISCYSTFTGQKHWHLAVPGSSVTFDDARLALCYLDIDARQLLQAPAVSVARLSGGDLTLMKRVHAQNGIEPVCKLLS
ncbi:MAG TPA: hypothetical protein VK112_12675 [Fodinibius sp.]|nr:hypothetical protein [Fodinibius sp.]